MPPANRNFLFNTDKFSLGLHFTLRMSLLGFEEKLPKIRVCFFFFGSITTFSTTFFNKIASFGWKFFHRFKVNCLNILVQWWVKARKKVIIGFVLYTMQTPANELGGAGMLFIYGILTGESTSVFGNEGV